MKYEKLLEKFKNDPDFYRAFRQRETERHRKYLKKAVYRRKRNESNEEYHYKKARGLAIRKYVKLDIPLVKPEKNFDFALVPEISVAFD